MVSSNFTPGSNSKADSKPDSKSTSKSDSEPASDFAPDFAPQFAPLFDWVDLPVGRFRVARCGEGPPVFLVHGFPESWTSWRQQMQALAAAGYCALAPDVRGYGASPNPLDPAAYSLAELTSDLCGLIDHYGAGQPAVVIGHDHGAPIAWTTALCSPERVRAVAGLSIPYMPPGPRPMLEIFHELFTARDRFFYQIYFQEPGIAEAEFEADPEGVLRKFYYALSGEAPDDAWPLDKRPTDQLATRLRDAWPQWLSAADLDEYVMAFRQSGFHGPLNRYRNHVRDFEFLSARSDHRIHVPALYIGGTRDLALKMFRGDVVAAMRPYVPELHAAIMLDGVGHWTQQEAPDEVNRHILSWLANVA